MQGCYNCFTLLPGFASTSLFWLLRRFKILMCGGAFGYKYRAAVFAAARRTTGRHRAPDRALQRGAGPGRFCFSLSSGICHARSSATPAARTPGPVAFGYSLAPARHGHSGGLFRLLGALNLQPLPRRAGRICRVHDVLNLLIFGFFCVLVMFEGHRLCHLPGQARLPCHFPLLMLAVVFSILCEKAQSPATLIARKPWHDTIPAPSGWGRCQLWALRPACARVPG